MFSNIRFSLAKSPEYDTIKSLIEKHNGSVVAPHEANIDMKLAASGSARIGLFHDQYDIRIKQGNRTSHSFTDRRYILDAIRMNKLPDKEQFVLGEDGASVQGQGSDTGKRSAKLPKKSGRTPFSRDDDEILIDILVRNAKHASGNALYKDLEAKNPRHTFHSWRDRAVKILLPKLQSNGELERRRAALNPGSRPTITPVASKTSPIKQQQQQPQIPTTINDSSSSDDEDFVDALQSLSPVCQKTPLSVPTEPIASKPLSFTPSKNSSSNSTLEFTNSSIFEHLSKVAPNSPTVKMNPVLSKFLKLNVPGVFGEGDSDGGSGGGGGKKRRMSGAEQLEEVCKEHRRRENGVGSGLARERKEGDDQEGGGNEEGEEENQQRKRVRVVDIE
ncbi:UNVERIFIED_CONTAM: hypothetical protein HDU68_009301 [Siphonaria sp. JEL0065]|nr:hypothetical protein HDU68_009301 [Siphonaria sp. JEL0065]